MSDIKRNFSDISERNHHKESKRRNKGGWCKSLDDEKETASNTKEGNRIENIKHAHKIC